MRQGQRGGPCGCPCRGRPAPRAARVRPRQARPSRVAPRDFTSEQFRREGRNLLRPLSQAPGTVVAK